MDLLLPPNGDYKLLDFGEGERLEQWGPYRIRRPDPSAEGARQLPSSDWEKVDARYADAAGKGEWTGTVPERWQITHGDCRFHIALTPYKHTGLFPEQKLQWDWMKEKGMNRSLHILNLFAYTGGATVALATEGHHVTHVDASKPAITWSKENAELNKIPEDRIRWMFDDALEFSEREVRRGKKYDGVILDPPSIGHSPKGKSWRVERDLPRLLGVIRKLLSDDPAFVLVNSYASHHSSGWVFGLLKDHLAPGNIDHGELCLQDQTARSLSTGIYARWVLR